MIIEPLRNYGVGSRLVLACEEYCKEVAIPYSGLDVNPADISAAKRLYERLGYHVVSGIHLDGIKLHQIGAEILFYVGKTIEDGLSRSL
ncbi:MAG: GNAT family N-acetyltransferase [Lachnospiraceae bacterium]|nr:GNAT family N-acetyltransferase [Lachnospiraceae bacterium]